MGESGSPAGFGLQVERTALAWRRTTLSMAATALAGAHFVTPGDAAPWGVGILGCAAEVGLLVGVRGRTACAERALRGGWGTHGPDARLLGAMTAVTVVSGLVAVAVVLPP